MVGGFTTGGGVIGLTGALGGAGAGTGVSSILFQQIFLLIVR